MLQYLKSPISLALLLGGFAATVILTPFVIRLARRLGAVDQGGYRKINGRSVPRMGGLAVALPFLFLCFLAILHPARFFDPLATHQKDFLILLVGGGAIVALGMMDDILSLGAKWKFLYQIAVALLVVAVGKGVSALHIPGLGVVRLDPFSGGALTVLWIVGVINAFNLIDGLDGLASGLGAIAALGLGAIAALNGQPFALALSLGLAGALGGFLVFNFNPARVFLGDTGSLFLGFVMAMLALMSGSQANGAMMLAPALVLGVPIFDTLTSMARRVLRGRSPFQGDRAHTHHRLLDYGFSQRQVALILYGVALLCTVSGVMMQVLYPSAIRPLLALGVYGLVLGLVAWANGFLRLRHIMRVARRHAHNRQLASFSRYARLSLRGGSVALSLQDVLRLGCRSLGLRFLELGVAGQDEALAGYYGEGNEAENTAGAEKLTVATAGGRLMVIRYGLKPAAARAGERPEDARERLKLERQDIMACLASTFQGVNLERLIEEASLEELFGEHWAGGSIVQDMSELVGRTHQALRGAALTAEGK